MSIFFSPDADAHVTVQDLRAITAARGIVLAPQDEQDYLVLLQAADAAVRQVDALPPYTPPALRPDGALPTFVRPSAADNPLNAWSHRVGGADTATDRGGPLAGRAVVFKDNISVAGLPLTCGTFPEFLSPDGSSTYPVSAIQATVVARVRAAGGVVAGTATCENYSLCALSYSSAHGPVDNPWAPGYATGGSSSGCAALLAARALRLWRARNGVAAPDDAAAAYEEPGIDLAMGGDQGGSIRLPSAFCGIYGLKPTHGLVPYTGIASLHPLLDHCGPMANSVADIALLLGAVAGYDGLDPRMTPESPLRSQVPDYAAVLQTEIGRRRAAGTWTPAAAGAGLRVGVLAEAWAVPGLDPEVAALVRAAAARFAERGAAVRDVSVPLHALGPLIWTAATRAAMAAAAFANAPPPLASYALPDLRPPPAAWRPSQAWVDRLSVHNPAAVNVWLSGALLGGQDVDADGRPRHHGPATPAKALAHVLELRAAYDAALRDVDVLLTPANLTVAPRHPSSVAGTGVRAKIQLAAGNTANTCPFNATGHPALSPPVGWATAPGANARGKLPVGMQIVGRRFAESDVLLAAAVWEVGGLGLDQE